MLNVKWSPLAIINEELRILHSNIAKQSFHIPHSTFLIPHSSFEIEGQHDHLRLRAANTACKGLEVGIA